MDILLHLRSALLHPFAFFLYYPILALISFLLLLFLIITPIQLHRISQAPENIPWVGLNRARFFPKLRAVFREIPAGRNPINEGYEKYSKHGKPFIVPGMHWNAVVLPPSNASWVAAQPEHVLSGDTVLDENLGLAYLTHGPSADSCRDFTVIRRDLTRQSAKLGAEVYDEVQDAFTDELGSDEEKAEAWKEISLFKLLQAVSFRAVNRVFVGLPLCRDKSYEKRVTSWTYAYVICAIFMRYTVPSLLKPIFMRVIAMPSHLLAWYATKELRPMVRERLRDSHAAGKKHSQEEHNDMMQWIITTNGQKSDPRELSPANIAGKMVLFNLFATSTTSSVSSLVLVDILSYSDAPTILSLLREEAAIWLPQVGKDPAALRKMEKLDSVIRETLRFNNVAAQGLVREVVAPGGITTPDGVHLPQGAHIHSTIANMQRDTAFYGPTAGKYDPFRFCIDADDSGAEVYGTKGHPSAVHLSPEYLSFGLGRHACPGRFFAVNAIKLMLGHLLLEYEVEPFNERPKMIELGEEAVPSEKTMMKVRKVGKDRERKTASLL